MTDWFQTWFTDDYLALYPHRDEADAATLVALIARHTEWGAGWRVLDVGCGPGRHAAALAASGVSCIGLDLSMVLLRRARGVTSSPLIRADMRRLPVRPRSMDATLSLFTSFGYFTSDEEHQATLTGMAATLRPGGWLVLDFLNASAVRSQVRAREGQVEQAPAGARVAKRLSNDGRFVLKEIELPGGARHVERVRLFGREDLAAMLTASGLAVRQLFGDYAGAPPADDSPRSVFLAQAA
jgi:SAM-dependent methyltransferase